MKHTKKKYNQTHKKRRNNKKTKKAIFAKKSRKQRGSGKYKTNEIYTVEEFLTNDCLNNLKSARRPRDNLITFNKRNNPYVKCRNTMRVLNTEKMQPRQYLKYREIIKYAKENDFYNTERGTIEDIGNKYIFDYVIELYKKKDRQGLEDLLKKVNPCTLIKILTLTNYEDFFTHLENKISERSKIKVVSLMKTRSKISQISYELFEWIKNINFDLNKLNTPTDLTTLFNNYYPINCPYNEKLNDYYVFDIKSQQLTSTNKKYINNQSWDLLVDIRFENFNRDIFSRDSYDINKVYGDLIGESFMRRLSTNIIGANGNTLFQSSLGDSDFCEKNKIVDYEEKHKLTTDHFNKFISILNDVGGTNKFNPQTSGYERQEKVKQSTRSKNDDRIQGTFEYDKVTHNQFIVNIIKFLAISTFPFIVNITRISMSHSSNYYGLFYNYFESNDTSDDYAGNCYFLYSNKEYEFTQDEKNAVNDFIDLNIPNNNYRKHTADVRQDKPSVLFPDCRIIDIKENTLYTFSHTVISLPFVPFPKIGDYNQIMKFKNILDENIENVEVTISGMILWNCDLTQSVESSVFDTTMPLGDVIEKTLGNSFYNGFLKPIFASLVSNKEPIRLTSQDITPRTTEAYMGQSAPNFYRNSNESSEYDIEL